MSEELNKEIEKLKKSQKKKNSHYTALEVSLGTMLAAETAFDLFSDVASYKELKRNLEFKRNLKKYDTSTMDENQLKGVKRADRAIIIGTVMRFGKHLITAATVAMAIHNGIKTMKDVNNIKTGKEISKKIGESKKKEKENKSE